MVISPSVLYQNVPLWKGHLSHKSSLGARGFPCTPSGSQAEVYFSCGFTIHCMSKMVFGWSWSYPMQKPLVSRVGVYLTRFNMLQCYTWMRTWSRTGLSFVGKLSKETKVTTSGEGDGGVNCGQQADILDPLLPTSEPVNWFSSNLV